MKNIIKSLAISLVASILIINPAFAAIPSDDVLDYYDQIGAYYYNPVGSSDACSSTNTILSGSTTEEKIWNFFVNHGFSDAQTAGIMGNAMTESGFEPTRASTKTFWGLFQWGYGRKDKLFEKIRAAGLEKYTATEYWPRGASKKIPDADLDRILTVELEFTVSETDRNWQSEIKKQTTPEAAAEVFLTLFERAVNGKSEILYYEPFIGRLYQGAKKRRDFARDFYKKYSGNGTVTSTAINNGKTVSIIGDSISNYSRSSILEKFSELSESNIDAKNGRTWEEGVEIAKSSKLNDVVIFALGTNSANLTNSDISNALNAIGHNHTIFFVTNYDAGNEDLFKSNNNLFKAAAKQYSNVYLADWGSTIKDDADKKMSDNWHPNEKGQKVFAETLYQAVNSGINENGCSISNEFTDLVKAYAWPEYHKPPYTNRMPAYAKAVSQSISENRYVGGTVNGVRGIDCGGFVTILVQNSGIAKDYNDGHGGTGVQERWVKSHNWLLLNKDANTPIDTSILQPGDVAFSKGHTFIYVGEIDGFGSVIASASIGNSTARAPMAGREDLIRGHGVYVRWYRNPSYNAGNN